MSNGTFDEQFQKLAKDLAANHLFLSVEGNKFPPACRRVLKNYDNMQEPPRIIVVLGAGASKAACGLPTGDEAAAELKKRLQRVNEVLLQEELERLVLEYRLQQTDFETQLLALGKFDQEKLLEELHNIFFRRHYPSLTYELLAHLFKHRFLDAIINFNFDELLDQAIDDEVGAGNYYRVVSDGDCLDQATEWLDEAKKRFRLPLYIKPHGTASQKSSLRFTRNLYTLLPAEFRRLLVTLFAKEQGPVKLLVLGHAMQSIEFNDILVRNAHADSEILFIDRMLPAKKLDAPVRGFHRGGFSKVTDSCSLHERMKELWQAVTDCFQTNHQPRQIIRHQLVSSIFSDSVKCEQPESSNQSHVAEYLKARVFVELTLAIAKAKGFVHLHQLNEGRAGKYFQLYKKGHYTNGGPKSLYEACQLLGLQHVDYSHATLRVGQPATTPTPIFTQLIVKREDFCGGTDPLVDGLIQNLQSQLAYKYQSKVKDSAVAKLLRETLIKMYDGDEVEVYPVETITHHELFTNPLPLHTLTALKEHTQELLERGDWDTLLTVAETGQWLIAPEFIALINKCNEKAFAVVVADNTYQEDIKSALGEQLREFRVLPWWLHNRHLTLFLKDGVVMKGLYFERRLRSSQILPLVVEGADANALLDTFVAYLLKAERYDKETESYNEIDRYIERKTLEEEKTAFLHKLYPNRFPPAQQQ